VKTAPCRLATARAASHGVSRHSVDSSRRMQDGYGFPPDPFGVCRPAGRPSDDLSSGRSRRKAHLALSRPFRGHLHESARPVSGGSTCVFLPRSGTCFLSWTSITLRHMPAWWTRWSVVDPSTTASRVEVWLPPSRLPPRGLATPDAFQRHTPASPPKRAGAPMGFALQGVSLDRGRYSSRSPMPSCRYLTRPHAARRRAFPTQGRLQGLHPAASPC
jgi:hypothetical protein